MHNPEICDLNGVVGVKGIGKPMFAVVVSMSSYLHFISYAVTLAPFCSMSLDRRWLSTCIVYCVWGNVPLYVGSIGCVVDDVADGISYRVCWSVSRGVGWSISCSVGSGVGRLHYFVFASTFFSHRVEGTLGTCRGPTVSGTSFFDLGSGDTNVGLNTPNCWRIFEVIYEGPIRRTREGGVNGSR
jgi:hypothetical protein